jgi:CheY-specific phosphatase CheX
VDQDKFEFFCNCFEEAFKKFLSQLSDIHIEKCAENHEDPKKKLSSVVGVVGLYKGRIHVAMAEKLIQKLYEDANGEPVSDEMDLCFYLAELTNMITGSGITVLNNTYKGSNLRLTPPAIFADGNLDIATPQVQSALRTYTSNYGPIRIEIGFEGV